MKEVVKSQESYNSLREHLKRYLSRHSHTSIRYKWVNILAFYFLYSCSFAEYWNVDFIKIFSNLYNFVSRCNNSDNISDSERLHCALVEPVSFLINYRVHKQYENTGFFGLVFLVSDSFQQNSSVVMQIPEIQRVIESLSILFLLERSDRFRNLHILSANLLLLYIIIKVES